MLLKLVSFCIVLVISLRLNSMQPTILPVDELMGGHYQGEIEQRIAAYKASVSNEEKLELCFTIGTLFRKQSELAEDREQKISLLDQSIHWYSQIAECSLRAKNMLGTVYFKKSLLITDSRQSKTVQEQALQCLEGYEEVAKAEEERAKHTSDAKKNPNQKKIAAANEACNQLLEKRESLLKINGPAIQFTFAIECLKAAKKCQEVELKMSTEALARALLLQASEQRYKPAQDLLRDFEKDLYGFLQRHEVDPQDHLLLPTLYPSDSSKVQTKASDSDTLKSQEISAKLCAYCNKKLDRLLMCSICKNVYYCNSVCQTNGWLEHRKECAKAQRNF